MKRSSNTRTIRTTLVATLAVAALAVSGCSKSESKDTGGTDTTVETTAGGSAETSAASGSAETTAAPATAETTAAPAGDTTAAAGAAGDCKLDEALKIGYAADFNLGGIGDVPASNAAKFQVAEINKAGGVGGKPVEIEVKQISQDPQDIPAAQRGVQELIDGGADIILGPPFSDYGNPLLESTKGEVPVLFVTSTETVLPDPARGSFLVSFDDNVQGAAAGELAAKQGFKNGVTMSSNEIPYLNIPQAAFSKAFTAKGGVVAKDLTFKLGQTDFSQVVNEIAGMSPAVDVVYSSFFMPEAGIFLKQLRKTGSKAVVIGADGFDASAVWSAGADAEGVFFSGHTSLASGKVGPFLKAYKASGGPAIETISFGALGSDAVQIAAAAATKACSTKGADLIKALSELTVDVTTGTTSYAGTKGTPKRNVTMFTVKGGKPEVAEEFYPSTLG